MQEVNITLYEYKREELLLCESEKQVLIFNSLAEKYHLATVEKIRIGDLPKYFKGSMYRDYNYFFLFDNN